MGQRERVTLIEKPAPQKRLELKIIHGRFFPNFNKPPEHGDVVISQERLSRILALQSRVGYETAELSKEWETMRKEMKDGATIEAGPHRAWLRRTTRLVKKRNSAVRKAITVVKLEVT